MLGDFPYRLDEVQAVDDLGIGLDSLGTAEFFRMLIANPPEDIPFAFQDGHHPASQISGMTRALRDAIVRGRAEEGLSADSYQNLMTGGAIDVLIPLPPEVFPRREYATVKEPVFRISSGLASVEATNSGLAARVSLRYSGSEAAREAAYFRVGDSCKRIYAAFVQPHLFSGAPGKASP